MFGSYLITFREVLEAALVVAIILAYISRAGRGNLKRYVWYGVAGATVVSLLVGLGVWLIYGAIDEEAQTLFEAIAALVAVVVLSTMIYWMATKSASLKEEVEGRLRAITFGQGMVLGLVFFSFVVVAREGIETVLFLTPFLVQDTLSTTTGLALGIASSLVFSYAVFRAGMVIHLRRFFFVTSILLVLLAGGLAGYAMHELSDYLELVKVDAGWFGSVAYSLNIPAGSLFHHKGLIGSIFAVMFGYTAKAEWGRLLVHFVYLAVALPLVVRIYRRPVQMNKKGSGSPEHVGAKP